MAIKPMPPMKTEHKPSVTCWATTFGTWVRKYGIDKLAKDLNVVPSAVYHWVHGRFVPRQPMMAAIIKLSDGKITHADLFKHIASVKPEWETEC